MKHPLQPDWERHLHDLPSGNGGFSEKTIRGVRQRTAMHTPRKSWAVPLSALLACCFLLAAGFLYREQIGAGFHAKPAATTTPPSREELILKVDYPNLQTFQDRIGRAFLEKHPSVKFTVSSPLVDVSDAAGYIEWAKKEKPDLLYVPTAYIDELAKAGLLEPLDPLIKRDGLDMDIFYPPVIQWIREAGSGQLYGMASDFQAKALFYNKTLFDQYGILPPHDRMSWEEVLAAASRFDRVGQSSRIYGMTMGIRPLLDAILSAGEDQGLSLAASDGSAPAIDSPAWRNLFRLFLNGYKEGWLHGATGESAAEPPKVIPANQMYANDLFLSGKAAMTYEGAGYVNQIRSAWKSVRGEDEWGIVSQPVDPAGKEEFGFGVGAVYAINAESRHKDAAWELLSQIMSGDQALRDPLREPGKLYTNMNFFPQNAPETLFYRNKEGTAEVMKSVSARMTEGYRRIRGQIVGTGQDAIMEAVSGHLTVEQALAKIQAMAAAPSKP